ncbi:hypothetical protein ACTFIW_004509 [Dictyostelium discoideum]
MDKTIDQRWLEYDKKEGPRYRDLLRNFTRIYRDKGRELRGNLGVQKALDATLLGMKSNGNNGADNEASKACESLSDLVKVTQLLIGKNVPFDLIGDTKREIFREYETVKIVNK